MGIKDEVKGYVPRRAECGVSKTANNIKDPKERKDFMELVENSDVPATIIAVAVKRLEYGPASEQSIRRHRQGNCLCRKGK